MKILDDIRDVEYGLCTSDDQMSMYEKRVSWEDKGVGSLRWCGLPLEGPNVDEGKGAEKEVRCSIYAVYRNKVMRIDTTFAAEQKLDI